MASCGWIDDLVALSTTPLNVTVHAAAATPRMTHTCSELLDGHMFSHKVDVYAFGILLWEIFSGDVPFDGCDFHEVRSNAPTPDWYIIVS